MSYNIPNSLRAFLWKLSCFTFKVIGQDQPVYYQFGTSMMKSII